MCVSPSHLISGNVYISFASSSHRKPWSRIVMNGICNMNMKSDMKIERTWIRIFIPSLISSLFKASNALLAIVKSIIRNARKNPVMNEYTNMNV